MKQYFCNGKHGICGRWTEQKGALCGGCEYLNGSGGQVVHTCPTAIVNVHIAEVTGAKKYRLRGSSTWNWTDGMFAGKIYNKDDIAEGDKIRFRTDLILDKQYGGITWLGTEKQYKESQWFTIRTIDADDFKVDGEPYWFNIRTVAEVLKKEDINVKQTEKGGTLLTECYYSTDMIRHADTPNTSKIVITSDGRVTKARLFDGKECVKETIATCSLSDEFDFMTGAQVAFERLVTDGIKEEPKESTCWNAKVVCISGKFRFTTGKVYEVKYGRVRDDEGIMLPRAYASLQHLNDRLTSQFILLVE